LFNERYVKFYDLFNSAKPYQKEIEFVYEWAKKPRSVFDIGAGSANYWKFYPLGVTLVGVDKSSAMAEKNKNVICADIMEYKHPSVFECATALFNVINYIPQHNWWKNLPLEKGGHFIFDIFDKKKVDEDGFQETFKNIDGIYRLITPVNYDGRNVDLRIEVFARKEVIVEHHKMYIYSHDEILKFCGDEFEVVEVKPTERWQKWYKLRRK